MSDIYYICNDCGKVFSESEMDYHSEIETSYSHGFKSYDVGYDCCPDCGSDNISPAHQCAMCGEYYNEEEMIRGDNGHYCQDCVDKSLTIENIELFDEKMLEEDEDAGAKGIAPTAVDLLGGARKANAILWQVVRESDFGSEDIRKALDGNLEVFMDIVSEEQNK